MTQINVCDSHEIVGRIHFLGQHPIFNFSRILTGLMVTAGSPSVSASLKEFTATCYKNLENSLARTIQETDIRMTVRVNNNREAKYALHMCGTGYGRVGRKSGVEYPNIHATRALG
jgi:hypothetical protein